MRRRKEKRMLRPSWEKGEEVTMRKLTLSGALGRWVKEAVRRGGMDDQETLREEEYLYDTVVEQ